MIFPDPPALNDPREWPEMVLYAATVLLEAEGESDEGKLGVAWVIRNRMAGGRSIASVILEPWQFSCWNADYSGFRRARLVTPDPMRWEHCWWATTGAYWSFLTDPTYGATHYLNEALTRKQRGDGTLPAWFNPGRVTARIGAHTFLRL